jgi:polar amino acid transport system substrate-binding protein
MDDLTLGRGDLLIAAITITSEREEKVDFSIPYGEKMQGAIVTSASKIDNIDELAGKKVTAQQGSSSETILLNEINDPKGSLYQKSIVYVPGKSPIDELQYLKEGKIDAVFEDSVISEYLTKNRPEFKTFVVTTSTGKEFPKLVAVAVREGNTDLVDVVNKVIKQLIIDGKIEQWKSEFAAQ